VPSSRTDWAVPYSGLGGRNETVEQPTAGQALRALEPLVGEWTVEAKGPDGRAWPGQGRASFQWHPSGAHLVQRVTTDVRHRLLYDLPQG